MNDLLQRSRRPILVVEDSDEDFDTILEARRRGGIENRIVRAASAEAARRLLPATPEGEAFAFVILDQNLPGINGCDFLREIRQEPRYRGLPVVLFTTSINPRDCAACYEAGANAYHVKSVRFDECLRTLQEMFDYWLDSAVLPELQSGDVRKMNLP